MRCEQVSFTILLIMILWGRMKMLMMMLWGMMKMLMKYLMMTIQLAGSNVLPLEGPEKPQRVIKTLPG